MSVIHGDSRLGRLDSLNYVQSVRFSSAGGRHDSVQAQILHEQFIACVSDNNTGVPVKMIAPQAFYEYEVANDCFRVAGYAEERSWRRTLVRTTVPARVRRDGANESPG